MFWSRSLLRCAQSHVPPIIMLHQARSLRLMPFALDISAHVLRAKQTPTFPSWISVLQARFKSSKSNSSKPSAKADPNGSPKKPSHVEHVPTAALHEGVLSATDGRRPRADDKEKASSKSEISDVEQVLEDVTKRTKTFHDLLRVVDRLLGRKNFNRQHLAQALHAYSSVMNHLLPNLERDTDQIYEREAEALDAFIRDPHRSSDAKILNRASCRPTEYWLNTNAKLVENSKVHEKLRWLRMCTWSLQSMLYAACMEVKRTSVDVPRWVELALEAMVDGSGTKWNVDAGYALRKELDSMSSPPILNTKLSSPRRR